MGIEKEFVAAWGDRFRVDLEGSGSGYIGVLTDRQAQDLDTFNQPVQDEDYLWITVEPKHLVELAHAIIKVYT